jgi:hypothetical protein
MHYLKWFLPFHSGRLTDDPPCNARTLDLERTLCSLEVLLYRASISLERAPKKG